MASQTNPPVSHINYQALLFFNHARQYCAAYAYYTKKVNLKLFFSKSTGMAYKRAGNTVAGIVYQHINFTFGFNNGGYTPHLLMHRR
jgi:uncharacterized protein YigE (DUF2233 family)